MSTSTGYSQNDEEKYILQHFENRVGRFLDIGAHNGVNLSNTRALAERGWTGTLVEPSPAPFKALMDTYRDQSDMVLVNAAVVAGEPRLLLFHDAGGDFVSTFDEAHRQLWGARGADGREGVKFQPIYVSAINMAQLVARFPGPYQFVNLDVEGVNHELFFEMQLEALGVELICVEYQDKLREIEERAAAQSYFRYHVTSENVLLLKV